MTRPQIPKRRSPIPILVYHQTTTPPAPDVPSWRLTLSPAAFARQLRALRAFGFRGLSMRDLEPYLRGDKVGRVVGITLDDGYLNNYEYALPILRQVGFTATSYLVSGQLGGSNVWDRAAGIPPTALMDTGHAKAWLAAGMDVGAHTRRHANLLECDTAAAREEVAGSKRDLENALGVEVRHFSYPYGQHRLAHAAMVSEAGYLTAVTVVQARVRRDDDLMLLPRISVHADTTVALLLAQVATGIEELRQLRRGVRPGDWTVRPVYPDEPVGGGGQRPL